MKSLGTILGGLGMIVALSGCNPIPPVSRQDTTKSGAEILRGKPISVSESYARMNGSLAIVLEIDNKYQLAAVVSTDNTFKSASAAALVQSEIADDDEDYIELHGHREGDYFFIDKIKAQGYTVNF